MQLGWDSSNLFEFSKGRGPSRLVLFWISVERRRVCEAGLWSDEGGATVVLAVNGRLRPCFRDASPLSGRGRWRRLRTRPSAVRHVNGWGTPDVAAGTLHTSRPSRVITKVWPWRAGHGRIHGRHSSGLDHWRTRGAASRSARRAATTLAGGTKPAMTNPGVRRLRMDALHRADGVSVR